MNHEVGASLAGKPREEAGATPAGRAAVDLTSRGPRRWFLLPRSLQWRLVVSYVALVILALALMASLLVGTLNSFFEQQTRQELALRAGLLASLIGKNSQLAGWYIPTWSVTLQVRIRLLDFEGNVIVDSNDAVPSAERPQAAAGLAPDTLVVTAPCLLGKLELSAPLTYREATLEAVRHDVLVLGLAAALAATLLGLLLGRQLTSPLRRLTAATERLSAGDLEVVLPAAGSDEIAELSRAFNVMAYQLRESFATIAADRDRLRAFVADVSHELRTPITALRTFNELLLQGAQDDPGIRQEFLEESATQIRRLDWLTQNLLDLSKLESGLVLMQVVPADLGETVRRALAGQEPAAAARQIALSLAAPPEPLVVPHDASRLEQAIANLINNAVKFSPPGSAVTVRLEVRDGAARLLVADEGAGIAPRDLPHIFERFYRGKELTAGTSGSGLGLAIVKSIVDGHGGQIAVRSAPGQGTTVELSLPLAGPAPSERATPYAKALSPAPAPRQPS